jgi:hydrogenase maturation protein HypF
MMKMPQSRIADAKTQRRVRVRLRGAVQGVGFRPFVYDLAARLRLAGYVRNDSAGVLLEAQGAGIDAFLEALTEQAPPLARVESIDVEELALGERRDFVILESSGGKTQTRIPPDAATCGACLDDLFNPNSRFYLYPFVACTHCGPRFTLTHRLPYDRAQTTMAPFIMCAACERDYRNPKDRRFHAEPVACPNCGPRYTHAPSEIAAALLAGKIVALKGVGGFHLMCDARNEAAVAELRRRKARDAKPFAAMVANTASLASFARASDAEIALLRAPAHPIVLLDSAQALAPSVAPGLNRIGVMLAYAPIHHLVFHASAGALASPFRRASAQELALVATSANIGGEPLVKDNDEAHRRLSSIADLIVTHDREIVMRVDDAVTAVVDGAPVFLRRARGFVPEPIDLGADGPTIVAAGGHLKATVTVTRGREAFVSQHIGDLSNAATARAYRETTQRLLDLLDVTPEAAACDLHPDYFSTRWAEEQGLPIHRAQHHAAHLAAIMGEHGVDAPALGVALDGHGLGADGGSWGGELMHFDGRDWRRLSHLAPLPAPGGDAAARDPWRMGVGALAALNRLDAAPRLFAQEPQAAQLAEMLWRGVAMPQTSSMGRLFDAAAALLGLRLRQDHEAQAAMELEALVRAPRFAPGAFRLDRGVLDFTPTLDTLAFGGVSPQEGAELLHGALIAGLAQWIGDAARTHNVTRVALGGGCFMSRILAQGLATALRAADLQPLLARRLPPNDGGLSFGQAVLARAALAARSTQAGVPCA